MKFMGYKRPDGSAGIRNYVTVLPASSCMNEAVIRICKDIENAVPLPHNQACSLLGKDIERKKRTLIGICQNPNVAAVLVIGLGCEAPSAQELTRIIAKSQKPVELITVDEVGEFNRTVDRGRRIVQELCYYASNIQREQVEVSYLTLAVKCAGSDPISAVTSNLIVGKVVDLVIEEGGTVVFSETTEMIGAEHVLRKRAINKKVGKRIIEIVNRHEEKIRSAGVDLRGTEPNPANIQEGITTIEEKSLGAIIKGGTKPIQEVLEYAEKPAGKGLYIMDSADHTAELITGMTAIGAQLLVVSMGGGIPVRVPMLPAAAGRSPLMPVLKIIGNPRRVYEAIPEYAQEIINDNFDISTEGILEDKETIDKCARRLYQKVLDVASGEKSKTEYRQYIEPLAIYTLGPVV